MITWMIETYLGWAEKRAYKRLDGIPLMWMIYKKDAPPPNVVFHLHPKIEHDEEIRGVFKSLAEMVRERFEDSST